VRRLIPYPLVTVALVTLWLVLNEALSPGHILVGIVAGLAGGWAYEALQPPQGRPRRLLAILRLSSLVFADIVRSNIAVARIVLGLGKQERTSGFVQLPLELRDPYALAALACIITSTPGTLWVDFDRTQGLLTIHVLDLIDESEWSTTIKGRYERLLLEIFE
jgi:multicomponent K+:H+ antiporter subunit E